MAFGNLKKWLEDRAKNVGSVASRAFDQVNPLDNGLSATTRRVNPAVAPKSAARQGFEAIGNIASSTPIARKAATFGAVAESFTKKVPEVPSSSPIRFANNLAVRPYKTTTGNAGKLLQGKNPYSGNLRQQSGQALQDVINVGSVVPVGKGIQLAQKGAPAIKRGMKSGLKVGAGFGAAQGVATANKENMNLKDSLKTVASNTAVGAAGGLVIGGAIPAAGAAIRRITPQPTKKITSTPQQHPALPTDQPSLTKVNRNDLQGTTSPTQNTKPLQLAPRTTDSKLGQSNLSSQLLPELSTKKVSNLDKIFRSTRSIIERSGEKGKVLAGELQKARDTKELFLADLEKTMPTVFEIAYPKVRKHGLKDQWTNKTYENFVDATQGIAPPKNARIAQAVKEWQAVHPSIRDRAVAAGLDVGDLGANYYPHLIDYDRVFKDKNTYNEAINHLVNSGQAENPEAAIKLLGYARDVSRNRQFGSLESARLVDLPFYDKTPESLRSYLSGSTERIANAEHFGARDEKALKLIKEAGLEGFDVESMKNAYDVAVGAKKYNQTTSNASRNIRRYVTTTRLGLGALTNVSQSVNTGVVTGHLRTMNSMIKQLSPKTREFVADTGVIADAVLNDIRTQGGFENFTSKAAGKTINKITAPGFATVEKFNRSVAATAGRDYALRLAQKGDEKTLRKLGVTGQIKNKALTEQQQIQAARKIVEKTQFKVDPQDLPGWADSPGGKLVAQFRTFSYNQGKFFSNEVLKPAARGNLLPLARVLAALPVGYGLYETRRTIDGRPQEEDQVKRGLEAFSKIGGAGLALDVYRSLNPINSKYIPSDKRVSMAVGTLGGPAAGIGTQGIGAVSELLQRKNTPEDESKLEGKLVVGKGEEYTDVTPIARFGISQIPIAGTPIRNRLLPYSKENSGSSGASSPQATTSTSKEMIQSAFSTSPERQEFIKLKDAEQRELAASDPQYRLMLEEKQNIERTFKAPDLYPQGMSEASLKILKADARRSDIQKENLSNKQSDYDYKVKLAKFERDKKAGKITPIEERKQMLSLGKDKVASKYSKEIRDLYGMSETEILEFIEQDPNGKAYAEQLMKYDQELADKGFTKNPKFKGGIGAKGSGGRGGRRRSKRGGVDLPSINVTGESPGAVIKLTKYTAPTTKLKVPKVRRAKRLKVRAKKA